MIVFSTSISINVRLFTINISVALQTLRNNLLNDKSLLSSSNIHRVVQGLLNRNNKNNSLVNEIAQKNSIKDINKIYVGRRLIIKSDGEIQPASSQTTTQNSNNATSQQSSTSTVSGSEAAAKAWIANRESGGNYGATNGQYIGKYQLSASYLNGDYSAANQERVADQYVASRYGSWTAAQQHWMANGWY